MGTKYLDKQVDTNHIISSPTIDKNAKQNIKEKISNLRDTSRDIKRNLSKAREDNKKQSTHRDAYDLNISDDTEEQQKDMNLQILGSTQCRPMCKSGLNSTREMLPPSLPEPDMHDIVDDDLDLGGIEPIQNSRAQRKIGGS